MSDRDELYTLPVWKLVDMIEEQENEQLRVEDSLREMIKHRDLWREYCINWSEDLEHPDHKLWWEEE